MNKTIRFIAARLQERSTRAGLVVLLALFGLPPGVPEIVGELLAAGGALATVLIPDNAPPAPTGEGAP